MVESNVPRVQCQPKVAVAVAVTAKMPNSTRCRLDGAQSIRAPSAAIWVAASTLKIAAVIDAWGVASNGRTTTYISAVADAAIRKTSVPISTLSRASKWSRNSARA
jgi:hypothetical protein